MQASAAKQSRIEGATTVAYDSNRGIVLRIFSGDLAGSEFVIDPAALRRDSRDALSVDEMTGEKVRRTLAFVLTFVTPTYIRTWYIQLLDPASVPDDVKPVSITKRGNYGVAIQWDDGHDVRIRQRTIVCLSTTHCTNARDPAQTAIYTYEQMIDLAEE